MQSTRALFMLGACCLAQSVVAQGPPGPPAPPTQNVNVVNSPDVNVVNVPDVNVANTPGVNVLNTPIPVTVESVPAQAATTHLGVPVENFAGRLYNDFGGVGTTIAFGPAAAAVNGTGDIPVQSGYDWIITDIDYGIDTGACAAGDVGKSISFVIAVGTPAIRHYLLRGRLDDSCELTGRDYMTAGFVVGEGQVLSGGVSCTTCLGDPTVSIQLRGYVVAQTSP